MRTGDDRTILQALSLINDCNKYKMDLTTNGVIITDAIKFGHRRFKEENEKESKEPDYDDGEDEESVRRKARRGNSRNRTRNSKSSFLTKLKYISISYL